MVQSADGAFSLDVRVGDQPLPDLEWTDPDNNSHVYVETKFDTEVTYQREQEEKNCYGERFVQKWPVTPYTLLISNASYDSGTQDYPSFGLVAWCTEQHSHILI